MLRNKADRATRALLREISRDNVDLFSSFDSSRSVPTRSASADSSAIGTSKALAFACKTNRKLKQGNKRNRIRRKPLQISIPKKSTLKSRRKVKRAKSRSQLKRVQSLSTKRRTSPLRRPIDPSRRRRTRLKRRKARRVRWIRQRIARKDVKRTTRCRPSLIPVHLPI